MLFHDHGYVSTDPRIKPAAGTGIDRQAELPDEMDVLIIGSGPAGMLTAAQLSAFPNITTRIIERRPGRLAIGQADGIQARSVETFQAFGFADEIINEAFHLTEMAFWKPDPQHPEHIVRSAREKDDPSGVSEFPHLIVNQARVLDYFATFARRQPGRIEPDFGIEFQGLEIEDGAEHPVKVTVKHVAGEREGEERVVRAKYVLGADGAHSRVRESIGAKRQGKVAFHAWGVMDVTANTDFPDIRLKCAITSNDGGSILHIPREGGYLFRMYVDLGEVPEDDNHAVRRTPVEEIIKRANQIIHPYTLDVRNVAWHSVYEVGHRVTDRFDDISEDRAHLDPHVFIAGDACHTHSAKAGQGMNVSMQDGFNLAWKLAYVLDGRSPASLLRTYTGERQVIAQNLIDFDMEWSAMMAKRPEEFATPTELEDFYTSTFEFPAGFMTQYEPSMITGEATHQHLATGFPVGKRFKSAEVVRICDSTPQHLGHLHEADGRWRVYVFPGAQAPGQPGTLADWAEWWSNDPESPLNVHTPAGDDIPSLFDVKVVYQQDYAEVELAHAPDAFKPAGGPFQLVNLNSVFATGFGTGNFYDERGISDEGCVIVVRPDQYVANIVPLTATDELATFFRAFLLDRR
ncbi:phenol 2-monooxygenase [Pseudoclavibacter endophyticus]|uniref:3-hydroxybenzoate 4-monooxygenase n=1 Tax=Pseudoclavibacter endophyticus TaxID=1778590 RepID=A0A6H9WVK1_9MICO|nr:FAD-binding monooxygenase [Pseudoclavibacter endophyticus]KAB1650200.1 3-hydroxybenzoate 4-monooxygenase [Pseudoclavibacter endophyticus]GGA56266.1 phenol 2-monooxygenase [Pseudoclavibacter endophyticus]